MAPRTTPSCAHTHIVRPHPLPAPAMQPENLLIGADGYVKVCGCAYAWVGGCRVCVRCVGCVRVGRGRAFGGGGVQLGVRSRCPPPHHTP